MDSNCRIDYPRINISEVDPRYAYQRVWFELINRSFVDSLNSIQQLKGLFVVYSKFLIIYPRKTFVVLGPRRKYQRSLFELIN
jgi:hypothetical protein